MDIRVFSDIGNKDKTFDQYTAVIGQNVFVISPQSNHSQGVNSFIGELHEFSNPDSWESEVELLGLPKAVLVAIIRRLQ